jgi:universal stress protein A
MKTKKILVPIDFSDASKKALQYAVHFAKQLSARIILLHVLPQRSAASVELVSGYDEPLEDEGAQAEAARRLKGWAEEFVPGGIETQIQTRRGAEALEIVNEARNLAVGLMIISTHGRTGRAHALAGSLAENLVQLAPCPVLVVREHECDFIETSVKIPRATDNAASAI